MNFYQSLGYLFFGSRLRRLSEIFLQDINKVYQSHEIPFEAAWFPIFYILSEKQNVSIREISDTLIISHSAVSQMISTLIDRGYVTTIADLDDARKKLICFTGQGRALLKEVKPVWEALKQAMEQVGAENKHSKVLLEALTELENTLNETPLNIRVGALLKTEHLI